jgi:hypothetical protein
VNLTPARWDERISVVQVQLFRRRQARSTLMALAALAGVALAPQPKGSRHV